MAKKTEKKRGVGRPAVLPKGSLRKSFILPPDLVAWIRKEAKRQNITEGEVIRDVLWRAANPR